MNPEPTNKEILEAVNNLGTHIENTDKQVGDILEVINAFSTKVDKRFDTLESDVAYLKSNMVTKDDLERSQAKLKGEIVLLSRKGDVKLREMASILRDKQVLTPSEFEHIMSMEPFAQLSV